MTLSSCYLIAHCKQIPLNVASLADAESREVSIQIPIYACRQQHKRCVVDSSNASNVLLIDSQNPQINHLKREENNIFLPCILLLSIKSSSSLRSAAGLLIYVLMFSSRYQLKFSSDTVKRRANTLRESLLVVSRAPVEQVRTLCNSARQKKRLTNTCKACQMFWHNCGQTFVPLNTTKN